MSRPGMKGGSTKVVTSLVTIERGGPAHRALRAAGTMLGVLVLLCAPFVFSDFRTFQLTQVLFLAVAVIGLNLLTGFAGQISLGHSAFFALGAYVSAILIGRHNWPYLATLPVAAAASFVGGYLFGRPALRLKGLYLAMVTIALTVFTEPFIKHIASVTGGFEGLTVDKAAPPAWSRLNEDRWRYFLTLGVLVVMAAVAWRISKGRTGRAMVAIRENEIVAETLGVNLGSVKTLTFAYSTMYAGVAGALYIFSVGYASPSSFNLFLTIKIVAAMVLGGLGSIIGALFGSFYVQFVPTWMQSFSPAWSGVIYGLSLVVVMFVMPGGFMSFIRGLGRRIVGFRDDLTAI